MEIRTVTANGVDFAYLEMGQGPLALCLHGFPDTAHTWRHLLPELAGRGYRAVAPFMRGYAPTSVPADGAYEPGALVADACALHEALGGDGDAVLIGHDWGAFPAYGAPAFAPARWRRAVAMAVPPPAATISSFFAYEQLKRSFYIFLFQTPLAETAASQEGFLEGLWRDWSPGYDAAEDVAEVRRSLADPANLAAAIGYYRAMLGAVPPTGRYAAEQAATGGDVPILYLHGEDDGCLDPGLAATAPEFLPPGSRTGLVADAGHFLHLERPKEVNNLILDWLAR
ncbi:alpha/beta fold hydrolase [Planomonospora venezuelensis]|uniref:Pimeloyl-ACP methyl ester carboxylesterase n=1 Tax=Planomonospora venezuelensis TaxID=1999 RepID=A0A841D9W4_PLAVE|nr:alpha/beta hydrolase [Planomonospora venezuelensis]MBB5965108.1 pimeloyl-ACP methyl ester carboxylesterase [Planomonospora venezuelensis]GIN03463.1 alpha/beta hydrolase [Planomonospora venezuelensis]